MRRIVLFLASMFPVAASFGPVLDTPSSAEVCGRCHRAIHEAWKASAHAHAMDSPLFQDAVALAEQQVGAAAGRVCLGCHSPVAVRTGDLRLRQKVSWEGVTCDYCHSLQAVTFEGNPKPRIEFTLVKSGPLKNVQSNVHGTAYSDVHTSAVACAPCHEYRNALGFPVLTTFSEWKGSRAGREGRACQSCHMYQVDGAVVDPSILRTQDVKVNLHAMPGSHSIDQLNRTIAATVSTAREGNQLRVTVEVANRAAGHSVPTGSPLRQLVLDVTASGYGGQRFAAQRVYKRSVADKEGKPVGTEPMAFLKAAKVISDTRLAADERRVENFTFAIPAGTQADVNVNLSYYYSPMARAEAQQRVSFLHLRRLVR